MKYEAVSFVFINSHIINCQFLNCLKILNVKKNFAVFFSVGVAYNRVDFNLIAICQAFNAF